MEATIISRDAITRPTFAFMLRDPAHVIALGAGAGLAPFAPGTAGTALAWLGYVWLAPARETWIWLAVLGGLFVLGIWVCGRTGRALGVADHGAMVWDEIVAFWVVLFFTPATLAWQAFAFALFRLFDILKPAPIRYFDRKLKGGFGVMFDDLVAAFYTLVVLAVTWRIFGG